MNKLKQQALLIIASKMVPNEVAGLKAIFQVAFFNCSLSLQPRVLLTMFAHYAKPVACVSGCVAYSCRSGVLDWVTADRALLS